jgi:serine/threonine protein kinase
MKGLWIEKSVLFTSSWVYLFDLEFCEGGDLAAVIRRCRKEKRFIPEDVIWNLTGQLLLALNECHTLKPLVIHRDIKPENGIWL